MRSRQGGAMRRALIVSTLMLVALVRRAEAQRKALGKDREQWLKWLDGSNTELRTGVAAWTMGVHDTLELVVSMAGCSSHDPVSSGALEAATADLLRQDKTKEPLLAAVIAFRKLSGCHDAINTLMRVK